MTRMLIAVGSVKAAPGATTLALGLAALWPRPDCVVIECDPSGGDLWARFGHHPEPGLSGLAAAPPWRGPIPESFRQRLSVGADAVLAIPGDGATAAVRTLVDKSIGTLRQAATSATVVLDVGRLDRGSPSIALAAAADHVLLLAAPTLAEQAQVGARLPWLTRTLAGRLWLVRAGRGGHNSYELSRDLNVSVIGTVPRGRWGAGVLAGQLRIPNWRQLNVARAVAGIAATLCALDPQEPATVAWRVPDVRVVPPVIGDRADTRRDAVR
ncbi:hypothetical protein ACN27G_29490 [Plantactinospora sp. WMMB334]|uniref:hypothetical protein n=1 Tax=Plantactinospora sp. WMMB334 TaxID=3404119 RepID=UPI003B9388F2